MQRAPRRRRTHCWQLCSTASTARMLPRYAPASGDIQYCSMPSTLLLSSCDCCTDRHTRRLRSHIMSGQRMTVACKLMTSPCVPVGFAWLGAPQQQRLLRGGDAACRPGRLHAVLLTQWLLHTHRLSASNRHDGGPPVLLRVFYRTRTRSILLPSGAFIISACSRTLVEPHRCPECLVAVPLCQVS